MLRKCTLKYIQSDIPGSLAPTSSHILMDLTDKQKPNLSRGSSKVEGFFWILSRLGHVSVKYFLLWSWLHWIMAWSRSGNLWIIHQKLLCLFALYREDKYSFYKFPVWDINGTLEVGGKEHCCVNYLCFLLLSPGKKFFLTFCLFVYAFTHIHSFLNDS